MTALIACEGCKAKVSDENGPTHRYMLSSPACWRLYGTVLARRLARQARGVDRFPADAYALQHPGVPGPQAKQSVVTHLVALGLIFEHKLTQQAATHAMTEVIKQHKGAFPWLDPSGSVGRITIVDVASAPDENELDRLVERWARATWLAWTLHHPVVRTFYPST